MAAVAQAIVVISGGIDLSVGSMMALTSVTAAVLMKDQSEEFAVAIAIGVLAMGAVLGLINGSLVVATRVPDIVVTLAMSFVWAGAALLVLITPGGSASDWLRGAISGTFLSEWLPRASSSSSSSSPSSGSRCDARAWASRSTPSAATGWRRSGAASRSGGRRSWPTSLAGLFAASGGLALTATTGTGTPVPGAVHAARAWRRSSSAA